MHIKQLIGSVVKWILLLMISLYSCWDQCKGVTTKKNRIIKFKNCFLNFHKTLSNIIEILDITKK